MTDSTEGPDPKDSGDESPSFSRRNFVTAASAAAVGGLVKPPASAQGVDEALNFTDVQTLARRLRARELSVLEVMEAFLGQIERVDSQVNAIPTLRPRSELLNLSLIHI